MQSVTIGTRVKGLGINRLNCAEDQKCRAILIDPNPQVKYLWYDPELRKRVECNEELVMRYGMKPSATFFYLVAKLNTDMSGNVIGDQFSVEYIQLSNSINNDFADAVAEMPNFASIVVTKVKKTADGRDFSYIVCKPSGKAAEGPLTQKIEAVRANVNLIESCWKMIDAATSITPEQYIALKENQSNPLVQAGQQVQSVPTPAQLAAPQSTYTPQPATYTPQPTPTPAPAPAFTPADEFAAGNDFGADPLGNDFGGSFAF